MYRQNLSLVLIDNKSDTHTHKRWAEVGVAVHVHVSQVDQQRYHAVEERQDAHRNEKLHGGRSVPYQVCLRHRAVTHGGIVFNQQHLV